VTDGAASGPPLRVGIVGTGFAAACHADALRRIPGVELAGIASRTPERAREVAQRLGASRAYDDPAALVEDPAIDAVHVCTINSLHADLCAAALRAGKHVVAEKPLATSSSESVALSALADEAAGRGALSAVCFNYRHYPLVQQIRSMLASGDYGRVHFVHGSYLQDWLLRESDWNWRLDPDANGASRAVADIGSHWSDLVQHVTGDRVAAVFADLATHHAERQRPAEAGETFAGNGTTDGRPVAVDTEDFGSILVRFESGARGTFAVSQTSAGRKNRLAFEIDAAAAAFVWDQEQPERAWVGQRDAPNLELVRDPALLDNEAGALPARPAGHPEGWRDALCSLVFEFYAAARALGDGREHRPRFASFADGHRSVLLVEAILRSHETEAWAPVRDLHGASA
jgi:predicted dehydrogenase